MLLFERRDLLSEPFIYGGSVSGYLVYPAGGICILMFLCALVLYRTVLPMEKVLEYISGVSMYINIISFIAVLIMLVSPTVHIGGYPIFCDYFHIYENVDKDMVDVCRRF
jgi:hypothetical protein